MSVMDWGDATEFVTFGAVGKDEVDDSTDVYLLVAPQNVVGNTILTDLGEHVRIHMLAEPHACMSAPHELLIFYFGGAQQGHIDRE